jgi:hypothetical protein
MADDACGAEPEEFATAILSFLAERDASGPTSS